MFANHSEFHHLQSDEALIQIGSTLSLLKINPNDAACNQISEQVKKLMDTQAVLLLVFAPDNTKFENENIIDVKGPYENGYFLIRLKTGSSIDIFKQFHQVVQLNGETYKNFASLPLHKVEPLYIKITSKYIKITSKYMTIKSRTDNLFKLAEQLMSNSGVVKMTCPLYDYIDPFILVVSGSTFEFDAIRKDNFEIHCISKDVYEKLSKRPLLPRLFDDQ